MTRTEQLRVKLEKIAERHADEIKMLSYQGKRGGHNAKTIPGWSRSTNNITRAGGLPMLNWWDGSNPTPSTGIPECCATEAYAAERLIFESK
jgi:hypothetical protein